MKQTLTTFSLTLAFAVSSAFANSNATAINDGVTKSRIETKVRHELLTLPYLGIFDNLQYRVDGSTVTLLGQVARPVLKSDAGNVIKHLEGVTAVNNQIEVLPLSSFDDQIRLRVAQNVYGQPALNRYALGAYPSIHIIVKNGNVVLEGFVANKMDAQIAYMQANQVFGTFSVKNNLQIDR